MTESLKNAVRYSIALGRRWFRWMILSLTGLLLQLIIPIVTWSVINVTADVINFCVISLDTNQVSWE